MKLYTFFHAILVIILAASSSSQAITINFEDGTPGSTVGSYYSSKGLTFSNAVWTDNLDLAGGSGNVGIIAQNNGVINNPYQWLQSNAVVAQIATGASSVSITGLDVGGDGLRIDAYDSLVGGSLLDYEQVVGIYIGLNQYFTLTVSSPAIKRLEIYQLHNIIGGGGITQGDDGQPWGDGIVLDDFNFTPSYSPPVPEPSTIFLLGAGLVGLAMCRRKNYN